MTDDEPTRLLRGLLAAVTALDVLPHAGPAGRVLLAAAVAGRGCSDDAVASNAIDDGRGCTGGPAEHDGAMPALLAAKVNRHPLGITFTGIRLTGEAERRLRKFEDYLTRA